MTEGPGSKDVFGLGERERQAVLAWVGENLTQSGGRRTSSESCTGALRSAW
jgi:hypothetical protein